MSDRSEQYLAEILRWIRASSHHTVSDALKAEFERNGELEVVKAKIFQMSDGVATSVQIAKTLKVSQSSVSGHWKRWRQLGLAEPAGEGGRQTRRCFSLQDFGMDPESKE
jgi:hypothetical protein